MTLHIICVNNKINHPSDKLKNSINDINAVNHTHAFFRYTPSKNKPQDNKGGYKNHRWNQSNILNVQTGKARCNASSIWA